MDKAASRIRLQVKKPQMTSWSVFVAPKNDKTHL